MSSKRARASLSDADLLSSNLFVAALTVDDIKRALRLRKQKVSGNRAQVVERLKLHVEEQKKQEGKLLAEGKLDAKTAGRTDSRTLPRLLRFSHDLLFAIADCFVVRCLRAGAVERVLPRAVHDVLHW